jgi:hypothetical protein
VFAPFRRAGVRLRLSDLQPVLVVPSASLPVAAALGSWGLFAP